jgi:hypothetical protein
MSIYREQCQQGFVLDDDLVEQNLHFTFSASSEEIRSMGGCPKRRGLSQTASPSLRVTRRLRCGSASVELCDRGQQLAGQTIFGYEGVNPLQDLLRNIHCPG